MKKLIVIILILLVLGFGGYFIYVNYFKDEGIIPEEEIVNVSEYYIFGDHLNMKGSLEIEDMNYTDICLTLYNGTDLDKEIIYNSDGNKIDFYFSEKINNGLYLDDIERGEYYLFLKITYQNTEDEEEPIYKYYVLDNTTKYDKTIYYTMSKYNNKIVIDSGDKYASMRFIISENKDKNIYDITIDPGHGGMDSGGSVGNHYESIYTMAVSKEIKSILEDSGFKVKLTHDEEEISKNDLLDEYNNGGRAVIPNEVKSKYTFSIHFNKNTYKSVKGIEVYTPANIDYSFSQSIADSVVNGTELGYSTNRLYKMYNGVYTRNFTEEDVASSLAGYEDKGYDPYEVSVKSNYYYMIRETGGYMTGAYVDDSNPEKVGVNPYYNSNIGNETYLLELGYLSNSSDLSIIERSINEIASAVASAITLKFEK